MICPELRGMPLGSLTHQTNNNHFLANVWNNFAGTCSARCVGNTSSGCRFPVEADVAGLWIPPIIRAISTRLSGQPFLTGNDESTLRARLQGIISRVIRSSVRVRPQTIQLISIELQVTWHSILGQSDANRAYAIGVHLRFCFSGRPGGKERFQPRTNADERRCVLDREHFRRCLST